MTPYKGNEFIRLSNNSGLCLWAFEAWKDEAKRQQIMKALIEADEEEYLEYIKKEQG